MAMRRRRRVRRAAKGAGLAASLLITALWGLSVFWSIALSEVRGGRLVRVWIHAGCVVPNVLAPPQARLTRDSFSEGEWSAWHGRRRTQPLRWLAAYERDAQYGWTVVWIPLWIPFLLIALPTGWLWWREGGTLPGHCRCGYSLAGLAPGAPCPECGASP